MAATLQLSVLELRQIWAQTCEDEAPRERVDRSMNRQDRDSNCCEYRGINALCLQAHHVVPRFVMRPCVNLSSRHAPFVRIASIADLPRRET